MRPLALAALALIAASQLKAQDSTCSYDRCAIWVRDGRLMVGMPGTRLRGGSDALLRITTTSDSARRFARDYASRNRAGTMLGSIGLFGALSYFLHNSGRNQSIDTRPMSDAEKTWAYGSFAVMSASMPFMLSAMRNAQRAAWWYNRDLTRTPSGRDSACTYDRCALWLRDMRVMAGMPGTQLQRPYDELPALLAGSDGLVHAQVYRQRILRGNTLYWVGAALMGGAVMSLGLRGFDREQIGFPALEVLALTGGLLSFEAGIFTTASANREAQRAIWYYNRSLPR